MGFIHDFFKAYYEMLHDAGFIERVIIIVLFGISVSVVMNLLFVAVVILIASLCKWWSGADADAAVEGQAAPPVAEVAALPAGGGQAARAVRRRRVVRDMASGEPGSSSSNATEHERE